MKYAKKIDGNQKTEIADLAVVGLPCMDTHNLGGGFPDFVTGIGDFNVLVELKIDRKQKLTPAEVRWHDLFPGRVLVATDAGSVLLQMRDQAERLLRDLPEIITELDLSIDNLQRLDLSRAEGTIYVPLSTRGAESLESQVKSGDPGRSPVLGQVDARDPVGGPPPGVGDQGRVL